MDVAVREDRERHRGGVIVELCVKGGILDLHISFILQVE